MSTNYRIFQSKSITLVSSIIVVGWGIKLCRSDCKSDMHPVHINTLNDSLLKAVSFVHQIKELGKLY